MEILAALLGLVVGASAASALSQLSTDVDCDTRELSDRAGLAKELQALLSSVLMITSYANLRACRRDARHDAAILAQLPHHMAWRDLLTERSLIVVGDNPASGSFDYCLEAACALTKRSLSGDCADIEFDSYDLIAKAWQDATQASLTFEQDAVASLDGSVKEPIAIRSRQLKEYAIAVIRGQWPCLSDAGEIWNSPIIDRRRHERAQVQLPAVMANGVMSDPATVVDISQTGLRLMSATQWPVGTRISIDVKGSDRMAGTIVWLGPNTVGVHLESTSRPLAEAIFLAHRQRQGPVG